jgi:hypothetical protein
MPSLAIFDLGETAALLGSGEDDSRPIVPFVNAGESVVQRSEIVPVDLNHGRPEFLRSARVGIEIPAKLGRPALTEAIDVDDHDKGRKSVAAGLVERLADGPLGHLAVPAQHPHAKRSRSRYLPASATPTPTGSP